MDDMQLERSLRSIGMECFVSYFQSVSESLEDTSKLIKQMNYQRNYSEKSCETRVFNIRKIIKSGNSLDAFNKVLMAGQISKETKNEAKRIIKSLGNDSACIHMEQFIFTPGHNDKKNVTERRTSENVKNIQLDHNTIQSKLYNELVKYYGEEYVSTEARILNNKRVDLMLKHEDGYYSFYEIKTSSTAELCIREAIGQLLEYAYMDLQFKIKTFIVVGENSLSDKVQNYLNTINKNHLLNIEYKQITLNCLP
jgi:hypothetical protein